MSTTPPILYVEYGDTIADIAMREKTSTSLTTTTAILLTVLLLVTFFSNLFLVATISASYKLRTNLLYLIFVQLGILNLIESIFVMFVSLLYVANNNWVFGELVCKLNATAQEFVFLQSFFVIMLMAVERALGLTTSGRLLLTRRYAFCLSLLFTAISLCFAAPALFDEFKVVPFPYRYICAIGTNTPMPYAIVQMIIYCGCVFVITICFCAIIRYRRFIAGTRTLPAKPQDYGAFIMESRALEDYMTMTRLIIFIFVAYILLNGPYLVLNFYYQIRNSAELLANADELQVSQDVDTMITFLMMFYPFTVTILIYCFCRDIWVKLVNLVFCRRSTSASYGNWARDDRDKDMLEDSHTSDRVLTLVATTEGLQIRGPNGQYRPPPIQPYYHEPSIQDPKDVPSIVPAMMPSAYQPDYCLPNQISDDNNSVKTHNLSNPRILKKKTIQISNTKTIIPDEYKIRLDTTSGSDVSNKASKIPLSNRQKLQRKKRKQRIGMNGGKKIPVSTTKTKPFK
ncbi:unnamed protein product [Bursaphelenchus okinawaensis]|uniref:G-protein coupled receptors family 1 profile domain-containing protein n=1 Tax=Bursaphelenchus okinawaensis TaxID=465554 RepID=A0A811KCP0_9BILA|nr:unnamed protein product [Bursaphelenchus okinawaensis]CAG9101775.1 unnamed protein product [Bursaphelenchus okinawaensis]